MKSMDSLHRSYAMAKFLTYFFLILGALIMVFPFAWMILTSSKTVAESLAVDPVVIFPAKWMLDNFKEAVASLPFGHLYWNTTLMVFFRVICAVLFSSMAGYAFAKLRFKGANVLFLIYLAQMMVPSQLTLIPRFVMFSALELTNTHFSIIAPKLIAVSATFMMRQAFLGVPNDLRESAMIDGAGEWRIWGQIMIPSVKPTLAALATVQFLDSWNSYLDPLVFLSDWRLRTLPIALNQFVSEEGAQYNLITAACCLTVIPVFVVFLCGQKFFVKGLTVGAVKG